MTEVIRGPRSPWGTRSGEAECSVVSGCAPREVGWRRCGPRWVETTGSSREEGVPAGGGMGADCIEGGCPRAGGGGGIAQRVAPGRGVESAVVWWFGDEGRLEGRRHHGMGSQL